MEWDSNLQFATIEQIKPKKTYKKTKKTSKNRQRIHQAHLLQGYEVTLWRQVPISQMKWYDITVIISSIIAYHFETRDTILLQFEKMF